MQYAMFGGNTTANVDNSLTVVLLVVLLIVSSYILNRYVLDLEYDEIVSRPMIMGKVLLTHLK